GSKRNLRESLRIVELEDVEDEMAGARLGVFADAGRALVGRPGDAVAVDDVLGELARVTAPEVLVQAPPRADMGREDDGSLGMRRQLLDAAGEALGRDPDRDPAVAERRRPQDGRLRAAPDPDRRRAVRLDRDPVEREVPAGE